MTTLVDSGSEGIERRFCHIQLVRIRHVCTFEKGHHVYSAFSEALGGPVNERLHW
jgi:hypothetical protein